MTQVPDASKETLHHIAECVQLGKSDADTNIPPGSKGQPGVTEWVEQALAENVPPQVILEEGLLASMQVIGRKFTANEVFIPEVLIAARAMQAGMVKLRPMFTEQQLPLRGVFVIGTVQGDLHDIGKNLVGMILEGAGWKIVDLGVDCPAERYVEGIDRNPGCVVGLSALLTTTMIAMRDIVAVIRDRSPDTVILVGGAPVTDKFAREIHADGYAPDPASAIELLDQLRPAG